MDETHPKPREWKKRLVHEFISYWVIFVYLAFLFAVFAWHRRLILAEQDIPVADYWMPLIEAAVLAKVILIIDLFGVAHKFESRALILPTLYKTIMFGIAIVLFNIAEATVRGLLQHHGPLHGVHEFLHMNQYELAAKVLSKTFALIPFFAFREIGRLLGKGTLATLFFTSRRSVQLPTLK